MVWKNRADIFHGVEKSFPWCGKKSRGGFGAAEGIAEGQEGVRGGFVVFAADEEELRRVPGMGPKRARAVRDLITAPYVVESAGATPER